MKEKIIEVIASVTKKTIEEVFQNFGNEKFWDSMQFVEIVFALEDSFDISFEQEELKKLTTGEKILSAVTYKCE